MSHEHGKHVSRHFISMLQWILMPIRLWKLVSCNYITTESLPYHMSLTWLTVSFLHSNIWNILMNMIIGIRKGTASCTTPGIIFWSKLFLLCTKWAIVKTVPTSCTLPIYKSVPGPFVVPVDILKKIKGKATYRSQRAKCGKQTLFLADMRLIFKSKSKIIYYGICPLNTNWFLWTVGNFAPRPWHRLTV